MKKQEKDKDQSPEGAWAAAGFAVVLVVVGLPVWWYTTTVYRAHLPYSTIEELSGQLRYHAVGLTLIGVPSPSFSANLEKHVRHFRSVKFHMSLRRTRKDEMEVMRAATSLEELDTKLSRITRAAPGTLAVFVIPDDRFFEDAGVSIVVGRHRLVLVKIDIDMFLLAKVLKSMTMDPLANIRVEEAKILQELRGLHKREAMRQVPTEPGYDVTLTLMVPEPHITRPEWNAKKAVDDYLKPVADQIESVAKLSIKSQVLYMTGLNVSPQWSESFMHYALPQDQLPLTINAIEAKLGSFVWTRPSLHFIIYIPREKETPLHIHTADDLPLETNSFLVPRWGGVMIHNVQGPKINSTYPREVSLDSHWIMKTVLTHLHRLLPVPNVKEDKEVLLLPSRDSTRLTEWQLDGLARARVSAYLSNIKITLQSLCELVGEISNMVISDEVGGWVWGAVEEWRECSSAAREGRLQEATFYCGRSFTQADAAFFHPSLLALLYFPDNQKYAIYVPLFLPVSIPVILSFKMLLGLYKGSVALKVKED
ncbi:GPI transamidase component PIG-S-like [Penaeus chinensis]|uniref:GPI transamidase component PIG-S-like n=1 Tax=Penaeus chinensis TaxID=139456 RepID=UPI001FB66C6F|nr:GPI transamidase component PIG-S-like [Penaeus chinensis]